MSLCLCVLPPVRLSQVGVQLKRRNQDHSDHNEILMGPPPTGRQLQVEHIKIGESEGTEGKGGGK